MRSVVDWFARNSVAANLLMATILVGGIMTLPEVKTEIFPEISSDLITVGVPYPGATPEECEEAICARVEEAVEGITGIKRVRATAVENAGSVLIELLPRTDTRRVLDEVQAAVDGITTFPEEAEKPVVQELSLARQVINVAISGPVDERTLKRIGQQVRDEIAALPGITQAVLTSVRPYEISVEVSEEALRRYGLTFDEVASALRRASLDLPGGSVKAEGGEILLRTTGQRYRGTEFAELVLRATPDGARLRLGDVARVVDGFAETDQAAWFDGEPAVLVQVFRVGDQNPIDISDAVHAYVEEASHRLPPGVKLTTWQDDSVVLRSRMDLLIRNGRIGIVLVFLSLALFLRPSLAFWVTAGIPVSFLGTIWLIPRLGVSINLVSLFAFIVVLGIVVDDAIVIGENIFTERARRKSPLEAAVAGVQRMAVPVVLAVLTTVAAFVPLLTVEGNMGKVMRQIPSVVIPTLLVSLMESIFILPAHLAHLRKPGEGLKLGALTEQWWRVQDRFHGLLEGFVRRWYRPVLEWAVGSRYLASALAVGLLLVTAGFVAGGGLRFTFFPAVEADNVVALLTMPRGTPIEATRSAVTRLEEAAEEVRAELEREEKVFEHMLSSVGEQPFAEAQSRRAFGKVATGVGSHLGEVNIQLTPAERRSVDAVEVAERWRERTGAIPDAVELTFTSALFTSGEPINIQLAGDDLDELHAAAAEVESRLAEYPGVFDIAQSYRAGKREIRLRIRPEAEALGFRLADLARQVRQGFFGEEVMRIQRGRDEVKVMVRYPREERRSLADIESMRVRLPTGVEVPFSTVAQVSLARAPATIQRVDRKRTINITADVDLDQTTANQVLHDMTRRVLPGILAAHPGLTYTLEGESREQAETLAGLFRSFVIALIVIYALLAIPFRSYIQPVIVMTAIPFGLVGALWGHMIMGLDLTILSGFGAVALTGVVVNDSLVMVDFINEQRRAGHPIAVAIREAGVARFRPILLTSLTTFLGLTPMLLEKSMQAQFLIPMATSLAFGVLFATGVTLVLVPVFYQILEDARRRLPTRTGSRSGGRGGGPGGEGAAAGAVSRV